MSIVPTTSRETEDATRVEQVAKKQKEYKLVGQRRKVPGHTLFEYNYKTKAEVHEGCIYVQALNKQNAEKKLKRIGVL